jgi:2-keto-4-pentenoate hydratase/2-oxohepta-3-ene-1,7-dioic acid hydratase in catechol pathway
MMTPKIRRFARRKSCEFIFGDEHRSVSCYDKLPDNDLLLFLHQTEDLKRQIIQELEELLEKSDEPWPHSTELLCPFSRMHRNIFCVGKNFANHVQEVQKKLGEAKSLLPSHPVIFSKNFMSVTDPVSEITVSKDLAQELDYEGEIVLLIGAPGRAIQESNSWQHVFGFLLLNDVSARDIQRDHQQYYLGKNLDSSSALGPWVTLRESVSDFTSLKIKTWVNEELRQEGCLSELIFSAPRIISVISRSMTLLPGDLISLGTPAGVGLGFNPPRFLRDGDTVRICVEELGELTSMVKITP